MNLKKLRTNLKCGLFFILAKNFFAGCTFPSNPTSFPLLAYVPGKTVTGFENSRFAPETITQVKSFYISRYETTKAEYKEIMSDPSLNTIGVSADPSFSSHAAAKYVIADGENDSLRPVENVTWYDAVYYCNLLSKRNGLQPVYSISNIKTKAFTVGDAAVVNIVSADVSQNLYKNGYRLPTQCEWEFAARGADPENHSWNYPYSGAGYSSSKTNYADKGLDDVAWYSYNICNGGITGASKCSEGQKGYGPHQVGLKAPNRLGLYDMTGNIEEWCTDGCYQEYVNPASGKSEGYFQYYNLCGGSWSYYASYMTLGNIYYTVPETSRQNYGFRVCRNAGF